MFGRLSFTVSVQTGRSEPLDFSVAKLMQTTEGAEIRRWVQFPRALLLFVMVRGDPESGEFFLLQRKSGTWYRIDFEDQKYGGYSELDFECLMSACRFARLVERPALLETCEWWVVPGCGPELVRSLPQRARQGAKKYLTTVAREA